MTRPVFFTTTLRDGAEVTIREIGPQDRCLMQDGFTQLSPDSRVMRFLASHPVLSEDELDTFTATNDDNHFAIGALSGGTPLATARYVRIGDSDTAEIALTVIDDWQGRGLGTVLIDALIEAGKAAGITQFVALLQGSNQGMRKLLVRRGAHRVSSTGPEAEYELNLYADELPRSA
ncbi:GNAT family N-acetyltransferase [Sulfitobacter sp. HNIBRBA3233]|uniref:GNAT family N-acetyltransferase n=1 Tax=Sulfitobacter marinivivus TaxID=3158558 RepID=UPI0032E04013